MKTKISDRHFATSFYTTYEKRARERCESKNCDIIIKWTMTRPNGSKYSGYDIGLFITDDNKSTACPQKLDMDSTIIWKKPPKTLPIFTSTSTVSTATQYNYY